MEENHFYPFGLTMAGISDKALKTQYAQNKYRYNGKELQNQEFSDGSGLEEYDYGARFQDPQLGIWHNLDPHSSKNPNVTPYGYVLNNPLSAIDPNGMDTYLSGDAARGFFKTIQGMMPHTDETYDKLAQLKKEEYGGESEENFTIKAVLPVYESITPETYAHIRDALNEIYPSILTRGDPKETKNTRNQAYKDVPYMNDQPIQDPVIKLWKDEYPFASTEEGVLGASLRWVPAWEQTIQSNQLSSLYSFVKKKDKFVVLPMSSKTYPYTEAPAWWSLPDFQNSNYRIHRPNNWLSAPLEVPNIDVSPQLIPVIINALRTLIPTLAI